MAVELNHTIVMARDTFLVSEAELDEIFERMQALNLAYYATSALTGR